MNDLEQKAMKNEVKPLVEEAKGLIVRNQESRRVASDFLLKLTDVKKDIERRFHPTANKKRAYDVYKQAGDTEKAFYEPFDEAAEIVKKNIKDFDRDEALKAQKQAQERERAALEKEEKEREKLLKKAERADVKGDVAKAEALREEAEAVVVIPEVSVQEKTKKLIWKCEVIDPRLACQSVAVGKLPPTVVSFKQAELNAFCKLYDGVTKIPGLKFIQDVSGRV